MKVAISGEAITHLSVLLGLLAADAGWGFYLAHFQLVYSTLGIVFGAGYAADHVTRLALCFMVALSGAACILFVVNAVRRSFSALLIGSAVYSVVYLAVVQLLPLAFQEFRVQPNELALERPYLQRSETGGKWSQQSEVSASDGSAGNYVGDSVGLSGKTSAVEAPGHFDGESPLEEAAYVFESSSSSMPDATPVFSPVVSAGISINNNVGRRNHHDCGSDLCSRLYQARKCAITIR